mmetsp:Transcript_106510/g.194157  ORF Transcript_106510/g.194157 Transcript_106510/m.194157 type:complete len:432 (-) Transcript_106510:38-1333(-)
MAGTNANAVSDVIGAAASGNVGAPAAPKRPGGGKTWSEVAEQVQKPDGSVRTSPPFKSAATTAASPQRLRTASHHLGKLGRPERSSVGSGGGQRAGSSHGGSSRGGSSGKSSRSSSRDGRHGDISSRGSSGGRDTSSISSSEKLSQQFSPRDPPWEAAPSPSTSSSKALLMPDPIRPLALLRGEHAGSEHVGPGTEHVESCEHKVDGTCEVGGQEPPVYETSDVVGESLVHTNETSEGLGDTASDSIQAKIGEGDNGTLDAVVDCAQLGWPLKRDPYGRDGHGRDGPRRGEAKEWSVEPLAKYLKSVVHQIDTNINNQRLPTAEKLDAFVTRLVANTQRQLRHAPKKTRHAIQAMCARRFHRFWNFARNEKVKATTPEELKCVLICLIEALLSKYVMVGPSPAGIRHYSQPKPGFQRSLLVSELVEGSLPA